MVTIKMQSITNKQLSPYKINRQISRTLRSIRADHYHDYYHNYLVFISYRYSIET